MADKRYVLKIIGDVFISGPVDDITFSTTKQETLSYLESDIDKLKTELAIKHKVNTIKVGV